MAVSSFIAERLPLKQGLKRSIFEQENPEFDIWNCRTASIKTRIETLRALRATLFQSFIAERLPLKQGLKH